ncbi:hypothetical protein [Streptomyces sp. NPDC008150]|uniref:hypothetical protein n=1 Tax=Streptomyces sp. NPDC008150 TaxID=3364816 RepID=UPI0036EDFEEC
MPDKNEILEAAVSALVSGYRADKAGAYSPPGIDEAVTAARAVGFSSHEIFGTADRRWGQELIDNAGRR